MSTVRQVAIAVLIGCAAASLWAQTAQEKPALQKLPQVKDLQIPRVASRPTLEEFLDGAERSDMRRVDDFRQRNPGDGVAASRKTTAYLGYDDTNLYAVFVCESPKGRLRARMGKREDILSDDIVGLFLDTFHDMRHGYEFFVNPYGIQADALITEGRNDEFSFDTLWYSDGRITSEGFLALIAIPFRSLRFTYKDMQNWGIGVARFIPEANEQVFWPFVSNSISGFVPQLGNAMGMEKVSPGRNLQIVPYISFNRTHYLDNPPAGPYFRTDTEVRVGFDAKAVIHDALTLDVAVNPDFSQVESDDPQVTVNQRFEVFFPERRPFFLENLGYFSTPENLFFSRRIGDPEFGARLTGKLGRWNMGFLAADDRAPGQIEDPTDPVNGKRAVISVARVQREFSRENTVGVLVTDRELAGGFNRVEAADMRVKLGKIWTFDGQGMLSQTKDAYGVESTGTAYTVLINRFSRKVGYSLNYFDRSPGFVSDLGYVPRVDIRQVNQFARKIFYMKNRRAGLISVRVNTFAYAIFDHAGRQQEWSINPGLNFELAGSTFIGANTSRGFERFNNTNFRNGGQSYYAHSEHFRKVTLDAGLDRNIRINYDPAGTLRAFRGDSIAFRGSFTLRPTHA
jgi:hypothetical protein